MASAASNTSNSEGNNNLAVAEMSDDWYHGHKVVAMPSSAFGGMSIREVVSSRNNDRIDNNPVASARPRRSNSLGLAPMRPGRDIIQDVYDRMGVSYPRVVNCETESDTPVPIQSQPSFSESSDVATNSSTNSNGNTHGGARSGSSKIKDKFSGRYRAAAANISRSTPDRGRGRPTSDSNTNASPRGRDSEPRADCVEESDGQRRARSLSRGKSVQGRWPPSNSTNQGSSSSENPNNMAATPTLNIPTNKSSTTNKVLPVGQTAATAESFANAAHASWNNMQAPNSPEPRPPSPLKRSHSFDARPQYGRGVGGSTFRSPLNSTTMVNSYNNNNKMRIAQPSLQDEKKESDEQSTTESSTVGDESEAPKIPSIKDRISAFAGKSNTPSSQRSARRNTFSPTSSYLKSAPPKVDIYEQTTYRKTAAGNEAAAYHPDDPGDYETHDYSNIEAEANVEDYVTTSTPGAPEPSSIPPSAAAIAAAEVAAKYSTKVGSISNSSGNVRPSQMVPKKSQRNSTGSVCSTGSSSVRGASSIVNSYLNGLQSGTSTTTQASSRSLFQQQQPATMDLPSTNSNATDEGIADGIYSLGATSSTSFGLGSTDVMINSDTKARKSWQKSGAYNSHINAANNMTISASSSNSLSNNDGAMSAEMIERMVDERVQVQLREVEARMEGLLRRWMDQMNTKITSRLDAMESSIKDSMPPSTYRREI